MKATKVLSLLLTAAMLLAVLPLGVWADSAVSDFEYTIADGEVTITGYTGEGGDVVIPSEIEGYPVTSIGEEAFWECDSLTSIVIPDSVTSIGDFVFYNCSSLTNIVIPDSVTSIGENAFGWCESLTSIVIPDSVTNIGEHAFYNCSLLTCIVIPNSVMSIGFKAFASCDLLTDIYCEADVQPEGWDEKWYLNCTATIWFNGEKYEKSEYFYEIKNNNVSITGYGGNGGDIVIPNEIEGYPVKSIGKNAFANCELLTSIVIPDSVTSIEGYAFDNCYSLTSISIPNSITSIGAWAFTSCDSLTSIVIPDGVTSIGHNAFYWCSSLSYIDLSDSVTSIGSDAFYHCTSLTSVDLPNTVTYIDYSVFSQCTSLNDIYCEAETQPEGWNEEWLDGCYATVHWGACMHRDTAKTEITTDATCTQDGVKYFICDACGRICSNVEIIAEATGHDVGEDGICVICGADLHFEYVIENGEVTITDYTGNGGLVVIPSEIEGYPVISIGKDAFSYNDLIINVVISDGIKYIGDDAFEECHYLQSVVIPDSVISIGRWAFGWCYELTEITIPASVTSMSYSVFTSDSSLESIYCEAETQPEGWNEEWLDGCYATVHWGACMHRDTAKTEITTDATCTQDGVKYFICDACGEICSDIEIIAEATGHDVGEDGVCVICYVNMFEYVIENGEVTITGYIGDGGDVSIPSEIEGYPVTEIGQSALSIASLTSVFIPESIINIGLWAFDGCGMLTSILVDQNNQAYYSEGNCLIERENGRLIRGCNNSVIPENVKRIGGMAFNGCNALTNITLPNGVTAIDAYAFYGCKSLENITIPDSVTLIGYNAFYFCESLTSVIIPDSVEYIEEDAFNFCSSMTDIYCEAEFKPETWDKDWIGYCSATVHWGYKPPVAHGDANGDGEINGLDVTRMMQYFANYDYETDSSDIELSDGADCNGDGVLDGRDVVRLLRYLANRDPLTGKSDAELGK